MSISGMSGSVPDFSSMRARMQENISERFNAGDTDQSGGLSLDEFSLLHKEHLLGGVGQEKIAGEPPKAGEIFSRIDENGDGQISQDEFAAGRPPGPPPPPQGNFSSNTLEMLLALQEEISSLFNEADKDQSGGLSFDEFMEAGVDGPQKPGGPQGAGIPPASENIFARLDQDSNGEVTLDEFASARPPGPPRGVVAGSDGNTVFESLAAILMAQEDEA
ncbi:MAG: EF-hand domain-containing protein [bacterium]|nr:EF-hand domain-containing protein [bacterium]